MNTTKASMDTNKLASYSSLVSARHSKDWDSLLHRKDNLEGAKMMLHLEQMMVVWLRELVPGLALNDTTFANTMAKVTKAILLLQNKNHADEIVSLAQVSTHIAVIIVNNLFTSRGYKYHELTSLLIALLDVENALTYETLAALYKYSMEHKDHGARLDNMSTDIQQQVFKGDGNNALFKKIKAWTADPYRQAQRSTPNQSGKVSKKIETGSMDNGKYRIPRKRGLVDGKGGSKKRQRATAK